jgi:hypothetical protein
VTKKLFKKIKPEKLSHTHQKSIHKELELSDWPPVGQVTYGGGNRSTRREPPTLGKQLVNFITCGCKSSAEKKRNQKISLWFFIRLYRKINTLSLKI